MHTHLITAKLHGSFLGLMISRQIITKSIFLLIHYSPIPKDLHTEFIRWRLWGGGARLPGANDIDTQKLEMSV